MLNSTSFFLYLYIEGRCRTNQSTETSVFLNILEMFHHLCRYSLHSVIVGNFFHTARSVCFGWSLRIAHVETCVWMLFTSYRVTHIFSLQFCSMKCAHYFSDIKLHSAFCVCPNYKAVIVSQPSAIKTVNSFNRFYILKLNKLREGPWNGCR